MARVNSSALLIGCDFYFPGTSRNTNGNQIHFPHLLGAVRDINRVEEFLVSQGVPQANISKLTASYDPLSPTAPGEKDRTKWPTHANIMRELDAIEKRTKPDGLVYIQFSGHGIQRGEAAHEKTADGGDSLRGAALATTDVLLEGGTYLTGYQLGQRIQAMVKVLGLRVTLVLDACFSGRGLRDAALSTTYAPRTIIGCHDISALYADGDADRATEEHVASLSSTRQSVIREDWLSHPVGCTVLTACGINQTAGEDAFSDAASGAKITHGVLTYWMLDCLARSRTSSLPSYATLRDYIVGKIKTATSRTKQSPVLYGDTEFEFFGSKKHVRRPACRVLEVWEDKVRLDVGSAQGVAANAVYDVYPQDVDIDDASSSSLALEGRIVKADAFHSIAQFDGLGESKGKMLTFGDHGVGAGSMAVLRSWALKDPRRVRVAIDDGNLKRLLKATLEKTHNLILVDEATGAEQFTITKDASNSFEIQERAGSKWSRLQRLPTIAANSEFALQKLAHLVRHVCRYREIERFLDHPRSTRVREDKFDLLFYRDSVPIEPTEVDGVKTFEVTAEEPLQLRMLYKGPMPFVWVVIFELSPSWGVTKKLECKLSKGVMEPDEYDEPIGFATEIPPKCAESDSDDTSDTFMAFIVEGEDELSWDELALEALPNDVEKLKLDFDVEPEPEDMRARFAVPKVPPQRHWGVVSFIVHSTPSQ
ncbi:hypothetical protein TWF696_000439 [Orbilia brochopaga]|uniref:Caspase domain-containing protein n=1 Tax=Orbilia brochopaga TaxID=3140254 RepID=A0AAV9VDQ6_9PEZI